MNRAQDSSSSKQSIGTFGDEVIRMPLQSQTLNILTRFAKGELNFTNTEQLREVLREDSSLSRFVEKFVKEGPQITLKEHAILRNRKRKNVDEEFEETTSVGEEAKELVGSENEDRTAIDEANDDDGKTEVVAETDDDMEHDAETDDDMEHDAETDDDMEHDAKTDDDIGNAKEKKSWWTESIRRLCETPIEMLIKPKGSIRAIAEKVANDEDLVAIAEKLLKPFQNDGEITNFDAKQYSEMVELFWENKNLHKALCDEFYKNPFLFDDFSLAKKRFVEEPPEDRIARIKTDSSFSKVLERDDPVAKLSGVLSMLVGYWTGKKMLAKLSKLLYSPDLPFGTGSRIRVWGLPI